MRASEVCGCAHIGGLLEVEEIVALQVFAGGCVGFGGNIHLSGAGTSPHQFKLLQREHNVHHGAGSNADDLGQF